MDGGHGGALRTMVPALRELNDLKRITSAGREGSIAARLFRAAWCRLAAGALPMEVCEATVADALAASRLGDLDAEAMGAVGLLPSEIRAVRGTALGEMAGMLPGAERFAPGLDAAPVLSCAPPAFVAALAAQPRAGVTCPGKPRLLLLPPESHAEHCLMVAVYGALLARPYRADPGTVFLASLAHHLHNALLPDSGFTGETLLGEHLAPAFEAATELALAQLSPALRGRVVAARGTLPDAATPEGRAFHAADTLDRVLQTQWHLQAAGITMDRVLGEMELVHDGPVKPFQDRVLAEAGLWP
ncbi:MAG: HD domain-containing protein [Acetobacteraceae bacterium]|nr:HD domain-containing protein [Acetobacteraceae bacterium]